MTTVSLAYRAPHNFGSVIVWALGQRQLVHKAAAAAATAAAAAAAAVAGTQAHQQHAVTVAASPSKRKHTVGIPRL